MADIPFEDDVVPMWYVSGPMRGLPDDNKARFRMVRDYLESHGNSVWSPADAFGEDEEPSLREMFGEDFSALTEANHIVFLPDWQNSAGARIEYLIAKELGLDMHLAFFARQEGADEYVFIVADMLPESAPPELEAGSIVRNGARQAAYGHPNQDFMRSAAQWQALGISPSGDPADVALAMAALKMSRLKGTRGHYDSIVDAIGYLICYSRIVRELVG